MNNNVKLNRDKYIGGSDYPIITEISKYKKPNELAGEKAGVIQNNFNGNEYTAFGNFAEPIIREWLNETYNTRFKEETFFEELKNSLPLRGNVDGYDKELNLILEIKTTSDFEKNQNVYETQVRFYQKLVKNSKAFVIALERTSEMLELFKNNELEELKQIILDKLNNNDFDYLELSKVLTKEKKEIEKNCIEFTDLINAISLAGTIELNTLPQEYENKVLDITDHFKQFNELKKQIDKEREELYKLMEKYNVKSIKNENGSIIRSLPTLSTKKYVLSNDLSDTQLINLEKQGIIEKKIVSGKKGFIVIKLKK